jgi:hypothetical protein
MRISWETRWKHKYDKKQTILAPQEPKGYLPKAPPIKTDIKETRKYFLCPFCLCIEKVEKFLISTKKGFNRRLVKCPECGNQFAMQTATTEWTPEKLAEFAYPYRLMGYWQKVKWEKFKQRLSAYEWTQRFWDRYKQLKGEDETETYEEYIIRKQKEEYQPYEEKDE